MSNIYLNTASCGLLEYASVDAVNTLYYSMLTESSTAAEQLRDGGLPRIRETIARFLQAPATNIAFVPNFSYALCAIVQALKGAEKVMLYRNDYPSVYEPFRINGFDIVWVEPGDGFGMDTEAMKATMLEQKVDMLVISHVQWMSGYRLDLKDMGDFCSANGILFIVDATQSLGCVPINIQELRIDVLIASNYKWMNAGFGHGIMYMSHSFLQRYKPVFGGNASYSMVEGQWKYAPSIRSYEPGHLNFHGLLILEAAVAHKIEKGIETIFAHNMALTNQLIDGLVKLSMPLLGPASMDNRSPIALIKANEPLQQYLKERGITVIFRNGYIRISMHYHNTTADVEALLTAISQYQN